MSFSDLFGSGEHQSNLGHFASIVRIAMVDGDINEKEELLLRRLSRKLGLLAEEYEKVIENPSNYAIHPPHSHEKRLELLYDLLRIIYADHEIDEQEEHLLKKYAVGLGFSAETSTEIVERSINILGGKLSFDDYLYLLNRK
ncbi:MAG TPA: TerB family tellurite resistance protein [Flavobacteriaceae bacterium]|nr:TerB family tellurite resistance protein [Flavobacteriaceae bacterium]